MIEQPESWDDNEESCNNDQGKDNLSGTMKDKGVKFRSGEGEKMINK